MNAASGPFRRLPFSEEKRVNERIVALDIGDVRIGVAVTDPTRTIASPVEVITRVGWGPDTRKIREICDRFETETVVSGLPLNMDGIFQDERLTTVTAEDALLEDGMSRQARKGKVDKVAAAIILEQWLQEHPNQQ